MNRESMGMTREASSEVAAAAEPQQGLDGQQQEMFCLVSWFADFLRRSKLRVKAMRSVLLSNL